MVNNSSVFNTNNRTSNSIKTSVCGSINSILGIIFGFVYRTVFIFFLNADYLGLNGLFTNVLQVLSLAELGITTSIVYRFYKPISNNDYIQVGRLMNYLKVVYRYIALSVFIVGISITPFIKWFIKDVDSIPSDINIYLIYVLFLLNSVSSYLFVYKQNILSADQRTYIVSIVGIITTLVKYISQIVILVIFRDFTLTLIIGIVTTIILNIIFSNWTHQKYKIVFDVKERILPSDKSMIINDTKAVMFHRVGATVKLSTDSIILSKFVSLESAGLYSNYSMIISGLQVLLGQLLGNFVSSVGNAHVKLSKSENYAIYKKLLFIDLWISCVAVVCTYLLINDFIFIWIGEKFLFDKFTVIMLCLQFYILISRQINISYIYGCGLFTQDRFRPLIEAVINLVLSIIGVKYLGIVGVFIGTVVSSALTVCWREPIILFKKEFERPVKKYWFTYLIFFILSIFFCVCGEFVKRLFVINSIFLLFVEAIVCFIFVNLFLIILFHNKDEFCYMKELIVKIFHKILLK